MVTLFLNSLIKEGFQKISDDCYMRSFTSDTKNYVYCKVTTTKNDIIFIRNVELNDNVLFENEVTTKLDIFKVTENDLKQSLSELILETKELIWKYL